MKTNKKILVDFLKKVKMNNEQQIEECKLDFVKEGLKINVNSKPQQVRVMGWLKSSSFEGYEELGAVGVSDLPNLIKVLERFSDKISLSKEGNLLTIKGDNKKVDVELVSETFISGDQAEPKLEFTETFSITSDKLKGVFADVQMNKDAYMTFETEEKKLKISNTGKYKFLNTFDVPSCVGGSKVDIGSPLIDSTSSLNGDLEINMKSAYPMKVTEKTENSVIALIIAPRINKEE